MWQHLHCKFSSLLSTTITLQTTSTTSHKNGIKLLSFTTLQRIKWLKTSLTIYQNLSLTLSTFVLNKLPKFSLIQRNFLIFHAPSKLSAKPWIKGPPFWFSLLFHNKWEMTARRSEHFWPDRVYQGLSTGTSLARPSWHFVLVCVPSAVWLPCWSLPLANITSVICRN